MQQSIVKNICHSPFDPKILNEVYSIYNYFKFEAGIKYSLEEVYVALTVPGIKLMEIIFIDFLEICSSDHLLQFSLAKNRAIRRFQLLLSWRFFFKNFFERFELQLDNNIQLLLISKKLDPIELRGLFYYFVKNIKFPTSHAKLQIILYQLSYDIVSLNKEHQGSLKETIKYQKQEKNKKFVLKNYILNKYQKEDTIFEDLGQITHEEFPTILEFGCTQVKKVFEDEDNKIVVFKNRTIPNILFYRQENRLYDIQGKEISELENKMKMDFNVLSKPRKFQLESLQNHLLNMDPYDMTNQDLDEFYILLGDLKVLSLNDLVVNTRRIWSQLHYELNEYATTTPFRMNQFIYDSFENDIKSIGIENAQIDDTHKMIKSFIALVKSYKSRDKNETLIPIQNIVRLPGQYKSLMVEESDYICILTLYDDVLRSIFKARSENKTTLSRQEVLDSKNIQMAKLSKIEKDVSQRQNKRLQPLDYDSTEEQRHQGVDSQIE